MAADELELVEWLRNQQQPRADVELGIGDDMAVLRMPADRLLVSCDILLDGVHFDSSSQGLAEIGRKAVACSLSDCAAMAVRPLVALMSLALPAELTLSGAKELLGGSLSLAAEFDLAVVGGDITRWPHPLAIDVSITATPYPGIEPVSRGGAGVGDAIYVTGPLGGSLLGRHLTFTPRVAAAKAIAEELRGGLHAMMDISDGLSLDLWRMCRASGVGATLDERKLQRVISDDAGRMAGQDGRSALYHALSDGEDFELLLAAEPDAGAPGVELYPIGTVTDSDLLIKRADGRTETLEPRGYVH